MAWPATILIAFVVAYFIWNVHSLYANYRKARQSGSPVFVSPVNTKNVIWTLFSVTIKTYIDAMSAQLCLRSRYTYDIWLGITLPRTSISSLGIVIDVGDPRLERTLGRGFGNCTFGFDKAQIFRQLDLAG